MFLNFICPRVFYGNIMKNRYKEAKLAWRNRQNVRLNAEPDNSLVMLRKVALSSHGTHMYTARIRWTFVLICTQSCTILTPHPAHLSSSSSHRAPCVAMPPIGNYIYHHRASVFVASPNKEFDLLISILHG